MVALLGRGRAMDEGKEDIAIKENKYGVDRFVAFFPKYINYHFPNQSVALGEEQRNRLTEKVRFAMIEHISTFHGESCIIEI